MFKRKDGIELYNSLKFDEFLSIVDDIISNCKAEHKSELEFLKANSLVKVGKVDYALPIYRFLLEPGMSDANTQIKTCINLITAAIFKKDIEYAIECNAEYKKLCELFEVRSECWSMLLSEANDLNIENVRAAYALSETNRERKHFQTVFVAVCENKRDIKMIENFYENISHEVLNINLLRSVFDGYIKHDLNKAREIRDLVVVNSYNGPAKVVADYIVLAMAMMDKDDECKLIELAVSISEGIKRFNVFFGIEAKRICASVFKDAEKRNRILVPSRFGIIGISPVVSALRDRIDRYARSNSPVLIQGESGTGKELAAQALHDAGDRAAAPFIPVNCAAVPESVFESQLFGHVAGAFTGAAKDQPGLIELAGEGTLFLDEVGELPLAVQAKLLRFLENGEYRRLGSEKILKSRARVLAATNRGLGEDSGFRQDLAHRLRRLEILLPPLRERREDIRYLARHRIRQLNLQDGSGWKQLDDAAEQVLESLDFAGNVRELFNLVDHAWHEAVQQIGPPEVERARQRLAAERRELDLPAGAGRELAVNFAEGEAWSLDFAAGSASLRQIQERAACAAIRQTLAHFDGDVIQAARFLDVSRRSIYRYLERERQEG